MYIWKQCYFRFVSIDGITNDALVEKWKIELTDLNLGNIRRPESTSLSDLPHLFKPPLSLEQQFDFLSHTPNSHYDKYLLIKRDLIATRAPSLHNHLLFSPMNQAKRNNNYAPTSFRQRLLYFLFSVRKSFMDYIHRTIMYRLSGEKFAQRKPLQTPVDQRRRQVYTKPSTNSPELSPEAVVNQYKLSEGYEIFREQMYSAGTIIVRNCSSVGGRLIMNACETKCGTIQVDKFVSLIYTKEPDGNLDLECNCPDYKRTGGEGGLELDPDGAWMDRTTRCMHIRLIFDNFEDYIKQVPNVCEPEQGPLYHLKNQIRQSSLTTSNSEVVVISHTNYLVLSVSLRLGDLPVYVKIHPKTHDTTSTCKCSKRVVKNHKQYWLLSQKEKQRKNVFMCQHITAVAKHTNLLHQFLSKEKETWHSKAKTEYFSKEKGKWISASLLTHKPKQIGDPQFQR